MLTGYPGDKAFSATNVRTEDRLEVVLTWKSHGTWQNEDCVGR